eukprot:CAMPEP_0117689542 /NCGR_PEP_ID=MMETSP0804-20121206/24558_1 /TAXON_ID=1074897 /ORGANISM="Tetraselmis astigmatica, Strain CCMP880" /LENGTH=82 /DNA_ID=CAMNT_0005502347 /DNA_START=980 /DNA_END=1226 /DNA_ORIENTATION=-
MRPHLQHILLAVANDPEVLGGGDCDLPFLEWAKLNTVAIEGRAVEMVDSELGARDSRGAVGRMTVALRSAAPCSRYDDRSAI